jgi:hypothetical protein
MSVKSAELIAGWLSRGGRSGPGQRLDEAAGRNPEMLAEARGEVLAGIKPVLKGMSVIERPGCARNCCAARSSRHWFRRVKYSSPHNIARQQSLAFDRLSK